MLSLSALVTLPPLYAADGPCVAAVSVSICHFITNVAAGNLRGCVCCWFCHKGNKTIRRKPELSTFAVNALLKPGVGADMLVQCMCILSRLSGTLPSIVA